MGRFLFYFDEEKIARVQIDPSQLDYLPDHYLLLLNKNARAAALRLAEKLLGGQPALATELVRLLVGLISLHVSPKGRRPVLRILSVGIQNLGCVCYMSAMMQLFFHIPEFKRCILGFGPHLEGAPRPQIQEIVRMFHFLSYSARQEYSPESFLKSFTPSINPGVQQDTGEFLSYLFDLLEQQSRDTPLADFLEFVFGGRTVTQMRCGGCNFVRSVEENFYSYGVAVKGQEQLLDAIDAMQRGEVIEDYRCEHCA